MTEMNLDIQSYSLEELFRLLNIASFRPTKEDMLEAKKRVLKLHPDKSPQLDSRYFLFYKKAYETVLQFYNEQNKQNMEITEENTTYNAGEHAVGASAEAEIKKLATKIDSQQFNRIWEENKMSTQKEYHNAWFQDKKTEEPSYKAPKSAKGIHDAFEEIKKKNSALIVHRDYREMGTGGGSRYFEDDEDPNEYISSDPFGKLKYDDLRKVHKDHTIFSVGESDFEKVEKYNSVDQYKQMRDTASIKAMEKAEAEKIINMRQKEEEKRHLEKLHRDQQQRDEMERRQKRIEAQFLRLK
jgi:hypothetical protein